MEKIFQINFNSQVRSWRASELVQPTTVPCIDVTTQADFVIHDNVFTAPTFAALGVNGHDHERN